VSRYLTLVPLGAGGMSELSLGVLLGAAGYRRPVVLKRARAEDTDATRAARRALVSEAHVAATLNHPNVIHVYELTEGPDGLTLAMEYLPGVSLQALLAHLANEGTPPPAPIVARIGADVARGLAHAHAARGPDGRELAIVHRDVSPKNLLVTESGITKVVDFGIARSTLREETALGSVKGTAGYLSPEQARGAAIDWRSDVFSLGIVLHEMLSLVHPFLRKSAEATMSAIATEPPAALGESVPAPLRALTRRMLANDSAHRQIAMNEVADELEALATGRGGGHRDVAALLAAELGPQLAARRERVSQLLAGATARAPDTVLGGHTATLVLLEQVLDQVVVSISEEHRPLAGGDEITDTLADDAYENAETIPRDGRRRR